MNIANGPVRPLPQDLNPPLDYCIRLDLPNDAEWISAFFDALYQLTYWFAWDRDTAHHGREVAAVWLKVLNSWRPCLPEPSKDGCCDDPIGDNNLLRQNPDNPCEIQTSANGSTWCTLIDLSLCVAPPSQPGDGSPQPHPGGCQSYHANFLANIQWLLPTAVNAGDVLTFSNPQGAATDGSGSGVWYCPAGDIFIAGHCTGIFGTSGADPRPASAHMGTIVQIAGVWYDTQNPITVPPGVVNAQAVFQVNDSNIADNSGGYAFDVEVCNNQPTAFEHVFDFLVSDGGWVFNNPSIVNVWAAGIGWQDALNAPTNNVRGVQLKRDFASTVLTSLELHYTMSAKDASATTDGQISVPTFVLFFQQPAQNGNIVVGGGLTTPGTRLIFSAFSSVGAGNIGSTVITKAIVRGIGADPF